MSDTVFLKKENTNRSELYVVSDEVISPVEVFVFYDKGNKDEHLDNLRESLDFVNPDASIRKISLKEIGLKEWKFHLKEHSISKGKYRLLDKETKDIILIWIALFFTEVPNWLSQNIVEIEMDKYGLTDEKQLYSLVSDYMLHYGLSGMINRIVQSNAYELPCFSATKRFVIYVKQFLFRAIRKMRIKCLTIKGFCHIQFKQKRYYAKLKQSAVLGESSECIPNDGGSSSSTFVKIVEAESEIFLKGNELPIYHSIENEIGAQKLLNANYDGEKWYLPMIEADIDGKWIKYPYVYWKTLDEYCSGKALSNDNVEKLGYFLCECIRKLKNVQLIHNDLRPGNILVREDGSGNIENFMLIDFGCATTKNVNPWGKGYWGRYMAETVCGHYRYSDCIVDDAVSAYLIFVEYGGKKESETAKTLISLFGKDGVYFNSHIE